jgi:hypothetical protein
MPEEVKPGETPPIVRNALGHEVVMQQPKPGGEVAQPPIPAPKPETQVAPVVPPVVQTEPKRVRLGAEEAIPDDVDLIEMPRRALDSRLARHTKAELKTRFGTSDVEEIKTKLDRLATLEAAEEERKRAQMSEQDRITADLTKERELRVDAERREMTLREDLVIGKEEERIVSIGVKHIRTKYVKFALADLATHLRNEYTDAELKNLKNSVIDEWFVKYAENNPELTRKPAAAPPPAPVRRVPLSNGARPVKPANAPASGASQAKSFAPSADNAMSTQEAKAEAGKLGYRW